VGCKSAKISRKFFPASNQNAPRKERLGETPKRCAEPEVYLRAVILAETRGFCKKCLAAALKSSRRRGKLKKSPGGPASYRSSGPGRPAVCLSATTAQGRPGKRKAASMLLRIFAIVAFAWVGIMGLLTWIASLLWGNPWQSAGGFAAFLTGLIGLILTDIAWSVAFLADEKRRECAQAAPTRKRDAEVHRQEREEAPIAGLDDWQKQVVTIDRRKAERAMRNC
jgi:nitrate reductase NapE component